MNGASELLPLNQESDQIWSERGFKDGESGPDCSVSSLGKVQSPFHLLSYHEPQPRPEYDFPPLRQ
jgi:hypothetical protein